MSSFDDWIKYILFALNSIFFLCGLALLITAIVLLSDSTIFKDFEYRAEVIVTLIFMLIFGSIIIVITSIGCAGIVKDHRGLLITFAVFLLLIFVLHMIFGIDALIEGNSDKTKEEIRKDLKKKFSKLPDDSRSKQFFDDTQLFLKCCGIDGPSDYIHNQISVLKSCCKDRNNCKTKPDEYYEKGCSSAMYDFFVKMGKTCGGLMIAFALIAGVESIFVIRLIIKNKS